MKKIKFSYKITDLQRLKNFIDTGTATSSNTQETGIDFEQVKRLILVEDLKTIVDEKPIEIHHALFDHNPEIPELILAIKNSQAEKICHKFIFTHGFTIDMLAQLTEVNNLAIKKFIDQFMNKGKGRLSEGDFTEEKLMLISAFPGISNENRLAIKSITGK